MMPARGATLAHRPQPVKGGGNRSRSSSRPPGRIAAIGCITGRCAMSAAAPITCCAGSVRSPQS